MVRFWFDFGACRNPIVPAERWLAMSNTEFSRREMLQLATLAWLDSSVSRASTLLPGNPCGLDEPGRAGTHDALFDRFSNPPTDARPGVWWRWIDGKISKAGITADFEAMNRMGIHQIEFNGQIGNSKLAMLSPEWMDYFEHALRESSRLGILIHVVPATGWGYGGPWVGPADAAKKLVFTEIQVSGTGSAGIQLPHPETIGTWYRDLAVVAFPTSATAPLPPLKVTASATEGGYVNEPYWPPENVADGDPFTDWRFTQGWPGDPAWIQLAYAEAADFVAVFFMNLEGAGVRSGRLDASMDGTNWEFVADVALKMGAKEKVDIPKTRARFLRLTVTAAYDAEIRLAGMIPLRDGDEFNPRPGIKWWRLKSANSGVFYYPPEGTAVYHERYAGWVEPDATSSQVRELTNFLNADGTLRWEAPPGRWCVLRFGVTLEGQTARTTDTGYEPDMFDPGTADLIFDKTIIKMMQASPSGTAPVINGVFCDSWEIGADRKGQQPNWSRDFRERFKKLRGYDLLPYLPVLARKIIDGVDPSDRFLWDFRLTLGDCYLEWYARLTEIAHARGIETIAQCGYGTCPLPSIDGLAAFGRVDNPQGEIWTDATMERLYPTIDSVQEAASAANIYGKKRVSAESLTAGDGYKQAPSFFKQILDPQFCRGMNNSFVEVWSLQPSLTAKPGIWNWEVIDRNMTWWNYSRGFLDYIARCQALLTQGKTVADVLYYYGEGTDLFVPSREFLSPALPDGYAFDFINAEVLVRELVFADGRLRVPSGGSWRYLVLPSRVNWEASATVLRKLEALVRSGATIIGPEPGPPPGLAATLRDEEETKNFATMLWSGPAQAGRVSPSSDLASVFALDRLHPDFSFTPEAPGADPRVRLDWIHRRMEDGADVYFIVSLSDSPVAARCTFRVADRAPEWWNPVSGETRSLKAFRRLEGRTEVPLEFAPFESTFVVFRNPGMEASGVADDSSVNFPRWKTVAAIKGPWEVRFDPVWGGPAEPVSMPELEDWTANSDAGIRYYSGTAVYSTTFDLPSEAGPLTLDLGRVEVIASVRVNGKELGDVWCAPWQVDLPPQSLKAGTNRIEISVANLWINRLIRDANLPPAQRLTSTDGYWRFSKDETLRPSGLLGPVLLKTPLRRNTG